MLFEIPSEPKEIAAVAKLLAEGKTHAEVQHMCDMSDDEYKLAMAYIHYIECSNCACFVDGKECEPLPKLTFAEFKEKIHTKEIKL